MSWLLFLSLAFSLYSSPTFGEIPKTIDPQSLLEKDLETLANARSSEDYDPNNFSNYDMIVSDDFRMRWQDGTIDIAYRGLKNTATGALVRWAGSILPVELIQALQRGTQGKWKFDDSLLLPTFVPLEWLKAPGDRSGAGLGVDVLVNEVPRVTIFGRSLRLFYVGLKAEPLKSGGAFYATHDGRRLGHVFPGEPHQYPDFRVLKPANPSWPPSTIANYSGFLEPLPITTRCTAAAKVVFDHCWYLGRRGESCDAACEREGLKYDEQTETASAANAEAAGRCEKVALAFGQRLAKSPLESWITALSGVGCHLNEERIGHGNAITQIIYPEKSDGKDDRYRRYCACK